VSAEAGLLRLVQRADWTRLSLAAETNDGSKLLLAPGRRYRLQTPARGDSRPSQPRGDSRPSQQSVRGCDGERPWLLPELDEDRHANWIGGPQAPLPMLLCPAWLLRNSRLEVRGRVTACGRDAIDVVATERSSIMNPLRRNQLRPGRTEALVDAEFGILLRVDYLPGEGSLPEDEEPQDVTGLEVDPVIDPAQFIPPPGSAGGESWGDAFGSAGPVAAVVQAAAGLAAGGVGAWINYRKSSRTATASGDADAGMPQDDPAPEMSPDGRPTGPEVSDEVLQLLHDSGAGTFDATAHEWFDESAILSQVPESVRRTGFGGFGVLISALTEHRAAVTDTVSAVRIGGPGQYQIDRQDEAKRARPKTIACDGQRRWLVHEDKVTVGPASLPPPDIGDLTDASWLLECWLSGGALIMSGDRPAYRLHAARRDSTFLFSPMMIFPAAVAVVDAELGIVLSLTSFLGGKPVRRHELRDVTPTQPGDFRVNIPPDLPIEPATSYPGADREHPPDTPLKLAGAVAQEVGKEAVKAARNFLRRLGT
jgi:hypothetical protein